MNTLLSKVVSENQRDWPEWLPAITAAYNASKHESMGFSAYYLVYRCKYSVPIDLTLPLSLNEGPATYIDYTEQYVSRMHEAFRIVNQLTRATIRRSKQRYDHRLSAIQLSADDFVWYYCPRRKANRNQKWRRLCSICLVEAWINEVNYRIRTGPRAKSFVAHIDRLQKFVGTLPPHLERWTIEADRLRDPSIAMTNVNVPENGGESVESTRFISSNEVSADDKQWSLTKFRIGWTNRIDRCINRINRSSNCNK